MKREELRALGVPEAAIDKVMTINGQDIERQKQGAEAEKTRADGLLEELTQQKEELEGLKGKAEESQGLQGELTTLREKYQVETMALQGKLRQAALDQGVELELVRAHARDTAAVRAMLDMGKIEQGEDGSLQGLSDQLEQLKAEKGWAFETLGKQSYAPKAGGVAIGSGSFQEAVQTHYTQQE